MVLVVVGAAAAALTVAVFLVAFAATFAFVAFFAALAIAFALAAADTDIGFCCFAGTVHNASHDGHLDFKGDVLDEALYIICKTDEIDLRSSAGRTGYDLNVSSAKSERLKDPLSYPDFLHRIPCERDPDRVDDALA